MKIPQKTLVTVITAASSCIQKDEASYSRGSDSTGTVRISAGTQSICDGVKVFL